MLLCFPANWCCCSSTGNQETMRESCNKTRLCPVDKPKPLSHPSIFNTCLFLCAGVQGPAGASCHWVQAGWHSGQIISSSQGHINTVNHSHLQTHIPTVNFGFLTHLKCMILNSVGRRRRTLREHRENILWCSSVKHSTTMSSSTLLLEKWWKYFAANKTVVLLNLLLRINRQGEAGGLVSTNEVWRKQCSRKREHVAPQCGSAR